MDRQSPWVAVSDRLPTRDEINREEIQVAYWIDGEWSINETAYIPEHWHPPHMRRPDFWTFTSLLAPDRAPDDSSA